MTAESGLLPFKPDVDAPDRDPGTLSLAEASEVLEVLSSETARSVLTSLYAAPGPASEVAERLEITIQTASYHLAQLQRCDLVHVVGRWYSQKGREMKVYAPSKDPLVLVLGPPSDVRAVARHVEE